MLFINIQEASSKTPSFQCLGNLSPVEKAICKDDNLGYFDLQLYSLYTQAQKQLNSKQFNNLKKEQLSWLKIRNNKCLVKQWNPVQASRECLVNLYGERIREIESKLNCKYDRCFLMGQSIKELKLKGIDNNLIQLLDDRIVTRNRRPEIVQELQEYLNTMNISWYSYSRAVCKLEEVHGSGYGTGSSSRISSCMEEAYHKHIKKLYYFINK